MASFKSAFAAARKAGKKEFTWNGSRYNTKLKEDGPAQTPKNAPVPTARPSPSKKGKSIFSGVDSDSLAKKKTPIPEHGRDRPGGKVLVYPASKNKPKVKPVGKSGATQGFGLGEAKQSAAFKKSNERASEYQKKLPGKIGKSLRRDY